MQTWSEAGANRAAIRARGTPKLLDGLDPLARILAAMGVARRQRPSTAAPRVPRTRRVLLGTVAALGLAGLFAAPGTAGPRGLRPGPARAAPEAGRLTDNQACIECHRDEADEWRGSLHQRAWVDPMFQTAFAIEPMPFCQGCHAPEADPRGDVPKAAAHAGVTCVSCHVVDGQVLAAPGGRDDLAPHAVRREPGFDGDAACVACHDFDFPSVRGQSMQSTITEHRRSARRDETCASCHMPQVGEGKARHRSHDFTVVGDAKMLQSAATFHAERLEPDLVEITLEPDEVGHAFPTGDLFRRLVVRVRPRGSKDWVERYLTRQFRPVSKDGHVVRLQVGDTRVGVSPGPSTVQVQVPDAGDRDIEWEIAYQRVLHVPKGVQSEARVVDETRLAIHSSSDGGDWE